MMDLYHGWFQKNGGCGYILKPAIMREEIAYFSANTRDVIPGVSPQILHIKIISGQNFPKPKGSAAKGDVTDPYVTIEVFGIPADCAEERTKTVPHNGVEQFSTDALMLVGVPHDKVVGIKGFLSLNNIREVIDEDQEKRRQLREEP
ncbi:phosphoinositide phospholipase C [Elysia marginata]|uniref:Phosphoinositide phospholipase C n=1 Tax=Elysia marginata TaxID=1093978 RepID=A0AAV4I5G1_9GAST|nr:phosphoinositide phospholipase C [Elysia marginata]